MASINGIAGKYLKEFCDRGNFVYYNTLAVYKNSERLGIYNTGWQGGDESYTFDTSVLYNVSNKVTTIWKNKFMKNFENYIVNDMNVFPDDLVNEFLNCLINLCYLEKVYKKNAKGREMFCVLQPVNGNYAFKFSDEIVSERDFIEEYIDDLSYFDDYIIWFRIKKLSDFDMLIK